VTTVTPSDRTSLPKLGATSGRARSVPRVTTTPSGFEGERFPVRYSDRWNSPSYKDIIPSSFGADGTESDGFALAWDSNSDPDNWDPLTTTGGPYWC
jgi:hypothetical protein